jgi:hypothetical protein
MEPFLMILVPGLLGGIVVALGVGRFGRSAVEPGRTSHRLPALSTDTINMARIRVSGVGGLGLVAMAVTVALFVPRIRLSLSLALALGLAFAVLLIVHRRRTGPLPSSGARPGGHTALAVYSPESATHGNGGDSASERQAFVAAPGTA